MSIRYTGQRQTGLIKSSAGRVNDIREAVSALSSDIRKSLTTQPRGMSHRPQCRCRKGSATVLSWKDYSLNSFNGFGLAEPLLTALTEERDVTPTPIQAPSIPILLSGR